MELSDIQGEETKPSPWGLWTTLGFSCLIILSYFVCGIFITAGFVGLTYPPEAKPDLNQLISNGLLVTLAVLISSPVIIGLTVFFARLRKGLSLKDYLSFHEMDWRSILQWSFILLLFAAASDGLNLLFKRPVVQEFLLNVYLSAPSKPLLWIALIVASPLSEEVFFRGFLFKGIHHSRLGAAGAILISSLAWAPLHNPYDLYGMATILALGLLFGLARLRTNSVYTTIVMHALMNLIAAMEVLVYLGQTSRSL